MEEWSVVWCDVKVQDAPEVFLWQVQLKPIRVERRKKKKTESFFFSFCSSKPAENRVERKKKRSFRRFSLNFRFSPW